MSVRGATVFFAALAALVAPLRLARAQSLDEVAVHGSRPAGRDLEETVSAQQASAIAGAHDDPIEVVEDLPGLSRPAFDSGQLIVWGSSPQDTQFFVDGVPIPQLFHGSAIRSTVNGAMIRSVGLSPGAYGADYGRSLGGLVRVETADVPADGPHGELRGDTLDGSAIASTALGKHVRVEASARIGWIADVLRAVDARDVGDYFAVPRYRDYQAKAQFDLRDRESVDVVVLGSGDDLTRVIPDADPALVRSQSTSAGFTRVYARYHRKLDDGSSIEVVPWMGHDSSHLDDRFGDSPADLDQETWRWGLRASDTSHPWPAVQLALGIDVDGSQATLHRQGSLEVPPREGDITVFGQPPGPDTNADAWNVSIVGIAPYALFELAAGPLSLSPGLRLDGYLLGTSRQTPRIGQTPSIGLAHLDGVPEPTLAARLRVTPNLALVAGAGVYSEPPAAADLSAVFGTPTLGPPSALHATAGETLRLTPTLSAEVLGFYKAMSGLAVRDPSPDPQLAHVLLDDGIGRAYGVQWLLRQQPWHGLSGFVSYTLSRSERRDAPGEGWRLFDYDQPHVLTIVANETADAWTFGLRFRYASGLPRTPVVGALYDASDDAYDPLFGPQNSIRLPDFMELDVRIDRAFDLGKGLRTEVYLEGLNVTDRANGEEFYYSADYTQRGLVTGLPILAVVGAKVQL